MADKIEIEAVKDSVRAAISIIEPKFSGRKGSVERAEGVIQGLSYMLTVAVMARHNVELGTGKGSSLMRRFLDSIEDWERQHGFRKENPNA